MYKIPLGSLVKTTALALFIFAADTAVARTLVIPPSPGDLSTVAHLKQSDDYIVEVRKSGDPDYTPCFVYKSDNYASNVWGTEHRPQKSASFTNFSFGDTAVDVRITTKFLAHSVTVRPLRHNIVPAKAANVFTFTLTSPKKISIEVNDRLNPLFIFADTPDIPNPDATHYFGPGVHKIGLHKRLNSNETVYIAGGAVVEGTFYIPDKAHHIEVRGRGIISNGQLPTLEQMGGDPTVGLMTYYATFTNNPAKKHITTTNHHLAFEGFIIANGAAWTFCLNNNDHTSHHNTWRNHKQIQWTACTDGIWFDGDDHVIDDCFIFNNDDYVTSHGSNNCIVSNTVFWGGSEGGHLFSHYAWASSSRNIVFENIDVIGADGMRELIVLDRSGSRPTTVENITFRNVRIEAHPSYEGYMSGKFISFRTKSIGVKNWLFENVTIDDRNADEGDIYGSPTSPVDGIVFRNLKMGGQKIMSLEAANIKANESTTNVKFE